MLCLTGDDSQGVLSAVAEALRAQGQKVFVCALRGHAVPTGIYDLVLQSTDDESIFERFAAKARALLRLGLGRLTTAVDAGTVDVPQWVVLMPGEAHGITVQLKEGKTEALARLRLAERHAQAVLAGITESALCLRPSLPLSNYKPEYVAQAMLNALERPEASGSPLSRFYTQPCLAVLPTALRALSTEVLALRPDADVVFKSLRDAGHVAASTLLPEELSLPGGRHLAHYMRATALCTPELWEQAPPAARAVLKTAAAQWALYGQAEALETLVTHLGVHRAVEHAAMLCCVGTGLDGMHIVRQRLADNSTCESVPTFVHAFAQCRAAATTKNVQALLQAARQLPRLGDQLVWGSAPIISNKYWSQAMREGGAESCTLMPTYYDAINAVDDYDLYFHDVSPAWADYLEGGGSLSAFLYIALNASVMHMPFRGGPLCAGALSELEPELLDAAGVRSVMISYGSDAYMYSRLASPTLTHVLNASYPGAARTEEAVRQNVFRWSARASFVLGWAMTVGNGFPRWDALVVVPFHIDTSGWRAKAAYSDADGRKGTVRILHCPNHRAFKGTEYIIAAVEQLRAEGLNVELTLLEKVQNHVVRETMQQVDILVDQCLAHYALNAIEGMVSGLAVCSNLDEPDLSPLRRFSYLNECPIVSVTPETLANRLRPLVRNPELRQKLGQAGRQYVEKYHSLAAARHLFGAIHTKLLRDESLDIQALYHPLLSEYVKSNPVPQVLDKGRVRPEDHVDSV